MNFVMEPMRFWRNLAVMTVIAVLIASAANADKNWLFFGVGGQGGAALAACGTGIIDLSAGCILPVNLGLVP